MPFLVSSSSPAVPALPCDPLAGANLTAGVAAPSTQTFDSVLVAQGAPGGQTPADATKTEANPPLTANSPGLVFGVAVPGADPSTATLAATAQPQCAPDDSTEPSGQDGEAADTESPADVLLRYQLVAGEWLVQAPAAQPLQPVVENSPAEASAVGGEETTSSGSAFAAAAQQRTSSASSENLPVAPTRAFQATGAAQPLSSDAQSLVPSADRPSDSNLTTSAVTTRQLPQQPATGTSVNSATSAATVAASAKASTPANAAAVTPTESTQASAANQLASTTPANTTPHSADSAQPAPLPAKLADPDAGQASAEASGEYSPVGRKDYRPVVSTSKALAKQAPAVGTTAATRENTMATAAASSPTFAASAAHSAVAAHREPASADLGSASVAAVAATQAPKLVHEIREISERVASIDRNTVEVKFDFNEQDRLSVRVEYRDGTVHTTFRTDSAELRDAISREWVTQTAAENRSFRAADPVFGSSTSGQQNLSSRDSHDNRQQAFNQASPVFTLGSAARSTGSEAASASATVPAVRRPETSVHLHTFA